MCTSNPNCICPIPCEDCKCEITTPDFLGTGNQQEIDYYTDKVYNIFKDHNLNNSYNETGIKQNVKEWLNTKKPLFDLFRKFPFDETLNAKWDEEAKAIVFLNTVEERPIDIGLYSDKIYYLLKDAVNHFGRDFFNEKINNSNLSKYCQHPSEQSKCDIFYSLRSWTVKQHIEEYQADYINCYYPNLKIKEGMKTSRAISKLFKTMGLDTMPEYNKHFAQIADTLNPLIVKRITVISLNICDYLLASNGNSWGSCHGWGNFAAHSGCYRAGCLSYANDNCSMVFYTISEEYQDTDYYLQPKISREMFFYNSNTLTQTILYPSNISSLKQQYRLLVESVIAKCEDKPNLWQKTECSKAYTSENYDTFHYKDYDTSSTSYYLSDSQPQYTYIGNKSYCIDCGAVRERYGDEGCETFNCSNCL